MDELPPFLYEGEFDRKLPRFRQVGNERDRPCDMELRICPMPLAGGRERQVIMLLAVLLHMVKLHYFRLQSRTVIVFRRKFCGKARRFFKLMLIERGLGRE